MAKDEEVLGKSEGHSEIRSTSPPPSSRGRRVHHHDVDKDRRRSKHNNHRSKRSQSPSRSRSRDRKKHKSYERSSSKRHSKRDRRDRRDTRSSSPEQYRKRSKRERHHKHKHPSKTSDKKKKSKHDETAKYLSKSLFNRNDLVPIGPILQESPPQKLDPDKDYFSYHNHLRLFLYRRDGSYFEDLTSSETHRAFEDFCSLYNAGNLESSYYPNFDLPQEALDQCKRTRHAWKFKTTDNEMKSLSFIKSGVKQQTEYDVSISKKEMANPRVTTNVEEGAGGDKDQLLRSMGFAPGEKIQIAPRE